MTLGPWVIFDHWLKNMADGDEAIVSDDLHAVLCGTSQALSRSFVGASTDCRYADLTGELPTASGYTAGGVILPSKTVTRVSNIVTLTSDPWEWTVSADIVFKYCVLVNVDSPNLDLVAFCDMDVDSPGTNTVTGAPPTVTFAPGGSGIMRWYQPV
jgi:hypothetical protein